MTTQTKREREIDRLARLESSSLLPIPITLSNLAQKQARQANFLHLGEPIRHPTEGVKS